jgi:anti-sigma B factor antagonist
VARPSAGRGVVVRKRASMAGASPLAMRRGPHPSSSDISRTAPLPLSCHARHLHEVIDLLRVTAHPIDGHGRVVLEVAGEVDHYTAPLLSSCLGTECHRAGLRELVVDLDAVTFLAAAGLSVLAQARRWCSTRDARLVLWCSGRRAVLRPLHMAGLSDLWLIDHAARRPPSAGTALATVAHLPRGEGGKQSQRDSEQPWRAE